MENKLIVSLSPHVHGGDSVQKNMYGVLIALIPAFLVSLYFFGLGALIVTATSVAACLFFEWAIGKYLLKKPTTTICDGSAIITGVLLAFNLPSNLPVWIIILGALFAIGVGKMSFGGLGCNPFNPALAGRVFLLLSFPVQMTSWPVVGQLTAYTDATTGATPLALMKQAIYGNTDALSQIPDALSLLIGQNGGCLGEVSALALLIGLAYMLWKKIITWHIPVSILVTVFVFAGIMHLADPEKIRVSGAPTAFRWSDAGCCLYGNRLCDVSDEQERYADLWRLHRSADSGDPSVRRLSRRYVVRHSDNECIHSAD